MILPGGTSHPPADLSRRRPHRIEDSARKVAVFAISPRPSQAPPQETHLDDTLILAWGVRPKLRGAARFGLPAVQLGVLLFFRGAVVEPARGRKLDAVDEFHVR